MLGNDHGRLLAESATRRAPRAGRDASASGGLRERNKRQKLERISRAARVLFTEKGFDETTTREIARRARVGAGTLFLYAQDKRQLLLRMFQKDLQRVTDDMAASVPAGTGLAAEVLHGFESFLDHYARAPELARVFLKELLFVGLDDVGALTLDAVRRLADQVEAAQRRGEIRTDVAPLLAATNLFGVYYFTLHSWLGGYFTSKAARSLLRNLVELQLRGLQHSASSAPPGAKGGARPRRRQRK